MIKNISILCLLIGIGGCTADVGGVAPPLPPCPMETVQPDMAVPVDMTAPACGGLGQPCCVAVDPGPLCNDGLVCDSGSNTCVTPPDMSTPPDLTPPDPCAGVVCDPPGMCVNGICTLPPDMATPPDMTDPCAGVVCPGSTCVNGACLPVPDMSTPPDMTLVCSDPTPDNCGGICTSVTSDPNNCGSCGNKCAADSTCTAGVCVPIDHCANVTCPNTYTCIDGQCVPPSCDYNQNCTFSYGYWKQHWVCNWQQVTLGTVTYDHTQLLAILNQSVNGNGLVDLAHQLIGAKMNIVKGANPASIQATINAADALIGSKVVPPIGMGSLTIESETALSMALADFNLGNTGPGHCQ